MIYSVEWDIKPQVITVVYWIKVVGAGCGMKIGVNCKEVNSVMFVLSAGCPVWVPGLRIDPLRLLAACRKRRLNQAPLNLCGPADWVFVTLGPLRCD